MSDAQFATLLAAVVAGLGGITATIRWAVGRITKAIDDNTASNGRLSEAQIAYAAAMAGMSAKLDHVTNWVHEHTPVEAEPIEVRSEDTTPLRRRTGSHPIMPESAPEPLHAGGRYHYTGKTRTT